MKKKSVAMVVVMIVLLLSMTLVACSVPEEVEPAKYQIVFDVDGTAVSTIETSGAEAVTLPADPEKNDAFFDGWYFDKDVWSKPFLADTLTKTPIKEDVRIYAKWMLATEGLLYEELEDGSGFAVSKGTATESSIVIASKHADKAVKQIADSAFKKDTNLTQISIPRGVTSIGVSAFASCANLKSVSLPEGLLSIGGNAFSGCSVLSDMQLPSSVTEIGVYAFYYCESLTDVTIPNGVNTLPDSDYGVFEGCSSLKSVSFAEGSQLTNVGDSAFMSCSALESIAFPNSVARIGEYAFNFCFGLKSVTISDSVTEIGKNAFKANTGLAKIIIPASVETIGSYAFSESDGLTIYAEPAVKPAGWGSNWNDRRPIIWDYQNSDLASDGNIYYTAENQVQYALKDAKATVVRQSKLLSGNISIPAAIEYRGTTYDVTDLAASAFNECKGLTGITFAEGSKLTTIGSQALSSCHGLTTLTIPSSVTKIGGSAFTMCSSLESITVADGNTTYHSAGNCLIETATKKLILGCKNSVIPADGSVTSIADNGFFGCSGLVSISIPNSVTSISGQAFRNCSSLTSITLPAGVTSLSGNLFDGCSALTSVTIPDSVTSIGASIFKGTGIWNNAADNSVVYVGKWAIGYKGDTATITNITLKSDTVGICDSAFAGCSALTNITIPDSVTSIGSSAFSYCSRLASITIPNSVTSIGDYTFEKCSSLTSIIIPNSVTSIGKYAFSGCSGLTSVTIGNSVTNIGDSAFFGCNKLATITIGNSVTSFGMSAFKMCSALTRINFGGTKTQWNAITKGRGWNSMTGVYTIYCTDGNISKG